MEIAERVETARRIEAVLSQEGYGARVWARGTHVRVYVTRMLSRRGRQEMGFVGVSPTGDLDFNGLVRQRAGVRAIVLRALAAK